jgi:putative heme-binding domain-containing protein
MAFRSDKRLWLIQAALLLAVPLHAQHSTTRSNPFNSSEDQAEGARLFRGQCAACHGPNGVGGASGPDLTAGAFRRGDSDEALFQIVAKGIPGTVMPAYAGSGREAWQIVAYVRSLSVGKAAERAKGDASRGERVFKTQGCAQCHTIDGRGGTLGPDLSEIGSRRSLGNLQRSVLNPNEEVSADYWTLRARTQAGQSLSGIRLNEDTHSLQFRDKTGLRSVFKKDLAEHEIVKTSPMPSFKGKLSDRDFEDLIAYLAARTERTRP